MTAIMPRLPGPAAEHMLEALLAGGEFRWNGYQPEVHPDGVRFAPTGGTTISANRLRNMRSSLVEVASGSGYPTAKRAGFAAFDAQLAEWISAQAEFHSGEALRDDIWSYIGVVMAPDVVHWRFQRSRERYLGGVRNTFQRVWLRARALDRGEASEDRWGLLSHLSEDALVAISERPTIGADPILARGLAEGWVRTADRIGSSRMEPVMRLATVRLRIRNEIQSLSSLPAEELLATIDEFFADAVEAIGMRAPENDSPEDLSGTLDNSPSVSATERFRRGIFGRLRS